MAGNSEQKQTFIIFLLIHEREKVKDGDRERENREGEKRGSERRVRGTKCVN